MRDLFSLSLLLVLGSASLAAFICVVSVLFPRRVSGIQRAAGGLAGRAFLIGLVNALFFGVLSVALLSVGERAGNPVIGGLLTLPALAILAVLSIGLSLGLAGVAQLIGERLWPARPPWARSLLGGLALAWACLLPGVGWFGLLPYAGLLGLGAFILSFVYRERPPAE